MSRVRASTTCCWWLTLASVVAAADPVPNAGADGTAPGRTARAAEQKLLHSLHKKVKAEWTDVPLDEVLQSLAKSAGVSYWINRQALQDEGITNDQQVNLHLGEATIWQALHFLLKPLGLTWVASDGVLEITTMANADVTFVTRTYDVTALAKVLEPQLKNQRTNPRSIGCVEVSNVIQYCVPEGSDATSPIADLPVIHARWGVIIGNQLVEIRSKVTRDGVIVGNHHRLTETSLSQMLQECIAAQWEVVAGEGGAISIGRGRLIVRQTYQTHFQIQALLHAVEALVVRGVRAKSISVRRPGYPHDEDAAILQRLATPQDIAVTDRPVDETLQSLAKSCGFRLWIDQQAWSDVGIELDTPVTLKMSGAPLEVILKKLLQPLQLTAVVEEGAVVITTAAKTHERIETVVHNAKGIAEAADDDILMTIVQKTTSGKWDAIEGEGGGMSCIASQLLVIRQSQPVHSEIAALLDDLREQPVSVPDTASEMELRIYPVRDETAISGLMSALPQFVPMWDAKHGSMHRLGQSLAIKQPAVVHDRLSEVFGALNLAEEALDRPKRNPIPSQAPAPIPPPVVPQPPVPTKPADKPAVPMGKAEAK